MRADLLVQPSSGPLMRGAGYYMFAKRDIDLTIVIAFLGFIALGIPGGLLGLAWPSIRDLFGLSASAIGALLLADTLGFMVTSFASGLLMTRFGAGAALLAGSTLRGVALLFILVAPSWPALILAAFGMGIGSGVIDAGLNTYVSGYRSTRLLNWLHGCFGLGATVGPLILTALFAAGFVWRWGYVMAGVMQLFVALLLLLTLKRWRMHSSDDGSGQPVRAATPTQTLRLPLVWLGIVTFMVYAGLEVAAGQWSFSMFTEGRAIPVTTAGVWVSLYWGSFTVGRFFFGALGDRLGVTGLMRTMLVLASLGAAILWAAPLPLFNFVGLMVIGFALAPVFPLLIAVTPQVVGARHTANAIGFQVGAASLGIAIIPWMAGVLVEQGGVESISLALGNLDAFSALDAPVPDNRMNAIAPFLLALGVVIIGLYEALLWMARRREAQPAAVAQAASGSD